MRRSRWCPNCGHEVVGSECRWCHFFFASDGVVSRKAQPTTEPVTMELAAEGLTETEAVSADAVLSDAQRKAAQIVREAERTARELVTRAKSESDNKTVLLSATESRQKAGQIMRGGERTAHEVAA